jgi:GNAT superfamily N-acetyltransferase
VTTSAPDPTLRIRVAAPADIPAMHRVRMSVLENRLADPSSVRPHHYGALMAAGGRAWVAEAGGGAAGGGAAGGGEASGKEPPLIVCFAVGDRERSSVWALFVEPGFEGLGIGRRLHDAMLEWLFARGGDRLRLGTDPGTRAERFYRAAGWRDTGVREQGEARFELRREWWVREE